MKSIPLFQRVSKGVRIARRRLVKWRDITIDLGPRDALFMYLREGLERDGWGRESAERTDARLRVIETELARVRVDVEALDAQLRSGAAAASATVHRIDAMTLELATTRAKCELSMSILEHTRWTASARLTSHPIVSVILATRNRPALVNEAVASVLAQTYPHWELIVVDDARPGETRIDDASFDDPRIRCVPGAARGLASARNIGLRAATGAIVTYLDDDNVMFPEWLKAVVVNFEARPDVDFVYGARVMERPHERHPDALLPTLHFEPFDRARLERGNFIDAGVIAHRAGLPGIAFDESLPCVEDWDLALRLTQEKDAFAIPVLASAYRMSAKGRLTDDVATMSETSRVVSQTHEGRRLSPSPACDPVSR